MLIDITLPITKTMLEEAKRSENAALEGHLGTHFDVMDKVFPLSYTKRDGLVFDVSYVKGRDIDCDDIALDRINKDMFVAFYSGFIEKVGYGEKGYFSEHPALSMSLIKALLDKGISVIGVDFAGVRRGKEHTPTDQHCAERGVFIVENLTNLKTLLRNSDTFTAHTYPMPLTEVTGLPCRVIAEI